METFPSNDCTLVGRNETHDQASRDPSRTSHWMVDQISQKISHSNTGYLAQFNLQMRFLIIDLKPNSTPVRATASTDSIDLSHHAIGSSPVIYRYVFYLSCNSKGIQVHLSNRSYLTDGDSGRSTSACWSTERWKLKSIICASSHSIHTYFFSPLRIIVVT